MANDGLEFAIEWLQKARNDWRSARALIAMEDPPTDAAAFHCQQTVEKILKSFLVSHNQPFGKTHLLSSLCTVCAKIDGEFDGLIARTAPLSQYAVRFRYPGVELPTVDDVHEALEVVALVAEFVLQRLHGDARRVFESQPKER